jgi:hypothetical protein
LKRLVYRNFLRHRRYCFFERSNNLHSIFRG